MVIGSGVEETGIMALDENQSLEAIYLRRETPAEIQEDLFEDEYYDKVTLYVPTGTKEAYALAPYWGKFKTIEEFTPTAIRHVKAETEVVEGQIYSVDGSRRTTLHRGLNILRSQGETRKIMSH